jgi:hypothetical protein
MVTLGVFPEEVAMLVREDGSVRERTTEITFLEPGAGAYALTFG